MGEEEREGEGGGKSMRESEPIDEGMKRRGRMVLVYTITREGKGESEGEKEGNANEKEDKEKKERRKRGKKESMRGKTDGI